MLIKLGEGGAMAKQGEKGVGVMATKLEDKGYNGKIREEAGNGNKTRRE
jgi:hypothetical protein